MKSTVTCCLAWLSIFTLANCQDNQVGGLQIAKLNGTVGAVAGNQIKFTTKEKEDYFAVVGNDTSVRYSGTAQADFLAPGILVRFNAEISNAGVAAAPIKKIEVFTVNQSRRISPEQMRDQTPGAYQLGEEPDAQKPVANAAKKTPASDAKKPVANSKKPPAKTNNKKSTPAAANQEYRVVGMIAGAQGKKFMVQAGNAQVQFELDPKAEISVNTSDPSFFQLGDEIKITGLRMAGQDKFVQCETVEVTGAKPLVAPESGATSRNSKTAKGKDDKSKSKADAGKTGSKTDSDKNDPKKPDPKKTVTKKPANDQ